MANEFKIKNGLLVSGSITGITESGADNSAKMASTSWVRTYVAENAGSISGTKDLQSFTATAGQTSFTITNGYTQGLIDVYLNGSFLNTSEYTATDGSTVVLTNAAAVNDIVDVVKTSAFYVGTSPNARESYLYTATASQTTFAATYTPGQVDVYYNGSKLAPAEFTATNGSSVVLATAATSGDVVEIMGWLTGGGLTSTRTLTINGVTYDLSANRTWTITDANKLSLTGGNISGSLSVGYAEAGGPYTLDVNGLGRFVGSITVAPTADSGFINFGTSINQGILDYSAVTGLWFFNNKSEKASTTDYFQFQADGTPILTLKKSGAATFSSSLRAESLNAYGTGTNDLLYLDAGVNTDFAYKVVSGADDALVLRRQHTIQAGLDIMSWTYSGKVGIGRTAPEFTLDVNGDIAFNRTNKLMFAGPVAGDRSRSYLTGDGNNNIFVYGPSSNLIATFAYTGYTSLGGLLDLQGNNAIASANDKFALGVNGTSYAWVQSFGGRALVLQGAGNNVGIGLTSNINAKLTVNGGISLGNGWGTSGATLEMRTDSAGSGGSTIEVSYWGSSSYGPLMFRTGNSERMQITSGGVVGIKTTPSSGWGSVMSALQIGTGGVISNYTGGNNNLQVGVNYYDNGAGSQLRLYTGGSSKIDFGANEIYFYNAASGSAGTAISFTERMRITSGGVLLVGATSNSYNEKLVVKGSSSSMGVVRLENNVNQGDVNHGTLMIVNTANYAIGNDASIAFALQNSANSFTDPRASIGCKTESAFGGALVFNTRLDGGTYLERLRIQGSGNVIHTAYNVGEGILWKYNPNGAAYGFYNAGNSTFVLTNSGVANVGSFNMSSGNYTALSDRNKKKDFEPSTLGLAEVLQLVPTMYRFKTEADDSPKHLGFIAQDVKDVVPPAYKEQMIGAETFIGLENTAIIPVLVKAVQELKAENDQLKDILTRNNII